MRASIVAISTALVVVGLFLEYGITVLHVFKFWGKREIPTFQLKIESPRERKGGALVVFGIAIELIAGVGVVVQSYRVELQHRQEIAALCADNLDLEQRLSPRLFEDQDGAEKRLRKFSGTPYIMKYLADVECHRAAEQIDWVLRGAHWKQLAPTASAGDTEFFFDGVVVEMDIADFGSQEQIAADALISELNGTKFDAHLGPPGIGNTKSGGPLIIRVGMKLDKRLFRPNIKGSAGNLG